MNHQQVVQRRIRVLSIRSVNPLGQGGCIFYGASIHSDGSTVSGEHFVVSVPNRLHITTSVEIGQWWDVAGTPSIYTREHNGLKISEYQIDAINAQLVLPSGRHIVTLMADGARFAGIGISKATRLWETFGERLYELLSEGRADLLAEVKGISNVAAVALIEGWRAYNECTLLQRLHSYGISPAVAENAIRHFEGTIDEALLADPYRLLSFTGSWREVDALALGHYQLTTSDKRRLRGAAEEVMYQLFDEGHTAPPEDIVLQRLKPLLALPYCPSSPGQAPSDNSSLATSALSEAQGQGILIRLQHGQQWQQTGAWVMESTIARTIADRLINVPMELFALSYQQDILDAEIDTSSNSHRGAPRPASEKPSRNIDLTEEQCHALQTLTTHRFALLSGPAGVGKTTLLMALYKYFDEAGISVIQGSIAGRAAQRMSEATQRPARTLASLLYSKDLQSADERTIVVIDEASMLDVITMYRLCLAVPAGVRILLVGDADQLMPVGPGLVFHELIDHPKIPHARLTKILRHGNEIAEFAQMIREGVWPEASTDEQRSVVFIDTQRSLKTSQNSSKTETSLAVAKKVVQLYLKAPESTQILCSLRNGALGVRSLNIMCQAAVNGATAQLRFWHQAEEAFINTGFRLGDPVVCTKNLWSIGILNGSLGRITEIEEPPSPLFDEEGNVCGFSIARIRWDDGETRPVTIELLPSLDLAYAITIHKAQGSQWPRVIVPVIASRLMDRSLLYTAVTRAQHQVLMLGDDQVAQLAVKRPSRSKHRSTALRQHFSDALGSAPQ